MGWFRVRLSTDEQQVVFDHSECHVDRLVRQRMWALWLLHCGETREKTAEILRVSRATVQRHVAAYRTGGLAGLTGRGASATASEWTPFDKMLQVEFRVRPARSVAEAGERIKTLTGLERRPTQVRHHLHPTLLYESPDRDVAFLSIESKLPVLQVAEEYVFRRGQEVIVIGSPGLGDQVVLQNAISRGIMSTKTSIEGKEFYQLGISINPGNSGGPAIDMTGKVVGIVTLKASKKEGLGFCIPPDQLLQEIDSLKSATSETIAKSQSMHRARLVFLRVHAATRIYQFGMAAYTDAMANALEKRVNLNVGLKAVREELEPRLSRIDELIVADIKRDVGQLGADVHLSDTARQRLVDMWTTYQELKGYVDNPRGNFDSYKMKLLDLSDRHKRATEALRLLLGVEPDES